MDSSEKFLSRVMKAEELENEVTLVTPAIGWRKSVLILLLKASTHPLFIRRLHQQKMRLVPESRVLATFENPAEYLPLGLDTPFLQSRT